MVSPAGEPILDFISLYLAEHYRTDRKENELFAVRNLIRVSISFGNELFFIRLQQAACRWRL
jgi:hypothetical protein